jgi:hypothetical protein
MNIEDLIKKFKKPKFLNPVCAKNIGNIDLEFFTNFKNNILSKYDVEHEKYITEELVFNKSKRIVGKTPYFKTTEQLYSKLDFDYELLNICEPIVAEVNKFIVNSAPVLIQIATLSPNQTLYWHIDTFLYHQFSNKIHLPVQTNPRSIYEVFTLENEYKRMHLFEGSLWNINNLILHRSGNFGEVSRVHLIIDFIDKDILSELDKTGINYFHTRLESMSALEKLQLIELKKHFQSKEG